MEYFYRAFQDGHACVRSPAGLAETLLAPATTGLSVSPFPGLRALNIVEFSRRNAAMRARRRGRGAVMLMRHGAPGLTALSPSGKCTGRSFSQWVVRWSLW